jgi:hypothetical protein
MASYGAIQLLGKMGPPRLFCTLRKIKDLCQFSTYFNAFAGIGVGTAAAQTEHVR